MSDERGSFWTSLGGVLTGVAAVVTAIAGLVGVIYKLPHSDARGSVSSSSERSAPKMAQESKTEVPSSTEPNTVGAPHTPAEEAPSHTATQPLHRISVGDNVIARWSDDCLYSATVIKAQNESYLVQYDFSGENWVGSENVFGLSPPGTSHLPPGTEVYAKPDKQQSKWLRSTVVRNENGNYLLSLEKSKCLFGPVYVWVKTDQIATAQ